MNSYLTHNNPMQPLGITGLDTIVTSVVTAITAASTVVLSIVPDPTDELKLLLVPLIGALLASVPTVLLYPERETRAIVFGRAGLSLILATLLPQTISIIFTSTSSFFAHPSIGLLAGVIGYVLIYIPIRSLFEGLYRKRKAIAEAVIEQGQQRLMGNVREAVTCAVDDKIHGPAAAHAANQIVVRAEKVARRLEETAEEVKAAATTIKPPTERLTSK